MKVVPCACCGMCVPTQTHRNEHTYIYISKYITHTHFFKEKETRTGKMALQLGVFAVLAEVWFLAPIFGSSQPLKTPAPGDLATLASANTGSTDKCKDIHTSHALKENNVRKWPISQTLIHSNNSCCFSYFLFFPGS